MYQLNALTAHDITVIISL